jgi:hypothetical protein
LTKRDAVAAAIVFLLSLAMSWPIFAHTGIPSLHHDWAWPADAAQARAQAQASVSPVIADNFGSLNFYQFNAPFWALAAIGETVFGSALALRIALICILGGGGITFFFFLRSAFGAGTVASIAGAVLYTTNAVVANRLAAGHLTYLVAYVSFPVVVWQLLRIARARSKRAWIVLVAMIPLAIVHPQFLVFPLMAALLVVPFVPGAGRVPLLLAALLPLALSPFTIAVALTGSPAHDLSFERTTLHWQYVNSAPLREALELSNGPSAYDQLASPLLRALRDVAIGALWVFAAIGAIRCVRVRPFFVLALFGLAMQWGLRGPLGAILGFFYTHYISASLFRELYHFAVFSVLGLAVCAVAAFPRAGAIVLGLILCEGLAQYSGAYFGGIAFETDRDIAAVSKIVSADRRAGYVAFLPMLQPVGPDAEHAGDDPQAFQFPGHATLHEFMPQVPLVQIDLALRSKPENADRLFATYGVRYVVIRPAWLSYYETSQEPALRALLKDHPAIPQRVQKIAAHLHIVWRGEHTWLARIDEPAALVHSPPLSALRRYPTGTFALQTPVVADPTEGWADSLRWFWWSPRNASAVDSGLITSSAAALHFETGAAPSVAYAWTTGHASLRSSTGVTTVSGDIAAAYPIGGGRSVLVPTRGSVTGFIGTGASLVKERTRAAARLGRCAAISATSRPTIALRAGCTNAAVEVLANRSLGYILRGGGAQLVPDPARWDAQYVVSRAGAVVENPLLDAMGRVEFAQYAAWALSVGAWLVLFTRSLGRRGRADERRFRAR